MREAAKRVAMAVAWLLAAPAGFGSRFLYCVWRNTQFFDFCAQSYSQVPGIPGRYLRTAFYHQALDRSELSAQFAFGSIVTKQQASIGREVYIGLYSSVGNAEIGDHTVLANYVSVLSGRRQHNFEDPSRPVMDGTDRFNRVRIGKNCFLGEKATVMADVGDACIVAAGSVVARTVPRLSVAGGVPAEVLRQRRQPGAE